MGEKEGKKIRAEIENTKQTWEIHEARSWPLHNINIIDKYLAKLMEARYISS